MLPTPAQLADHDSSTIYYMEILDENADSEETMSQVAEILIEKFSSASQKWVILVGDGKTYEHLLKVKRLYGSALENLLIFPGDWHVLKNFQPVIMKAYYHAGLREIAKECGYRAETLNSLEKCSHFKRTHSFLMQVWEAMYLEMVHAFITVAPQFTDLLTAIEAAYNQAMHNKESTVELLLAAEGLIKDANALNEFNKFVLKQAEADDTWKLWSNFVFKDCFCYIALFLAIRTSNWDLRVWSLKSMAPLFSAYDRPCYQKLVPNHIQDIQRFPDSILKCFQAGGFTVKLKAGLGHAVALDEAHECCINRDMKMAVVRPTQAYLRKTTFFFSYRIKAQKQLASQLFPASETSSSPQQPTIMDGTATTKHYEENIEKMSLLLSQYALLPSSVESNRGIVNVFTGTKATPEQTHDLINARNLGEQGYINYVSHYLLQLPSVTEAPIRRKRLLSMAPIKATKRRTSHKEKEERDTIKYLRRRLAWCNQTGQKYDEGNEQYSLLPRALAEIDGSPHKGNKSKWTDKLQSRYNAAPFMSALQWIPEVVIIDAMFSINTNPLRQHKSITDYAYLLYKQFVVPHHHAGTKSVHLVFDHPGRLAFNPKDFEHKRRYCQDKKEHKHIEFTPQSPIPRPWREYLECRICKRSLVEALGLVYLRTACSYLREGQTLVLAGCFSGEAQDDAWVFNGGCSLPEPTRAYTSNAQEADMRLWRHVTQMQSDRILVYSPDTDVCNIGLVLVKPSKQYVVQINLPHNPPRYIDVHKVLLSFQHDPDMAPLPQEKLGSIMLQLYIVTGCDYISYLSGIGKATFINHFVQHAGFISGTGAIGCLSETNTNNMKSGFLSFVRLIGTVYFKKNLATVVSKLGFETPKQLYNSIDPNLSDEEKHKEWYLSIKRVIRVVSEDQRPPTITALWRHWMRSCWIKQMWGNSPKSDQYEGLPPPESHGWLKGENGYVIDWEAEDVQQKIQATLDFLDKGCGCKTGCKTKRCSCKKKGKTCGAGCDCRGCTNVTISNPVSQKDEELDELEDDEEDLSEDSDSEEEILQTEIITDVITDDETIVDWFP